MGLFGNVVQAVAAKAKDKIVEAIDSSGKAQTPEPENVEIIDVEHVGMTLTNCGWERVQNLPDGDLMVKIRKAKRPEDGNEYDVFLIDGTLVGHMSKNDFLRSGAKTRGNSRGIVMCRNMSKRLIIPITQEALERKKLNTWISVSIDHWTGPHDGVDLVGGDILECKGGGKPSYVITAEGVRLCDVTSRMKCYETVSGLCGQPIRRVIANRKEGDFEPYYRVGLYF